MTIGSRALFRCSCPGRFVASSLLAGALFCALACGSTQSEPAQAPSDQSASPQQGIVNRSAEALTKLRQGPQGAAFEAYLSHARGVMVFPRVVKASLLVGGEGGNGVLVIKRPDGSWSEPAFYSLGAPSIGLQIGYQEATVVLFVMDDDTLRRVADASIELGSKSGVTMGRADQDDSTEGRVFTKKIYQLVEAQGAFAGISLDGYVITPRDKHNVAYYGPTAAPWAILRGQVPHQAGADVLTRALTVHSASSPTSG